MQGTSFHIIVALGAVLLLISGRASAQESRPAPSNSMRGAEPSYSFVLQLNGQNQERILMRPSRRQASLQVLPTGDDTGTWERRLAIIQGSYYTATGLWPILHMRSFEEVTGPKADDWLVKTVGALITVVGGTLLASGLGDGPSSDLKRIAAGSAAALAVVDVVYVAQGRISRIYLLDAAAELALVTGWGITIKL